MVKGQCLAESLSRNRICRLFEAVSVKVVVALSCSPVRFMESPGAGTDADPCVMRSGIGR